MQVIKMDDTEYRHRTAANRASDVVFEAMMLEADYLEESGLSISSNIVMEMSIPEYVKYLGGLKGLKVGDLLSILCQYTELLDPEEEIVKLD